ncbi:MAG: hypothetical protein MUE51_12235 [Thermoleophilia bacterium]|jgi:hypothetical protein|nr:hypothetical protein [Thermoleophilia bacterium]
MSERQQRPGDDEALSVVDGLVDALRGVTTQQQERRLIFAKGENYRHIRHAQILARWPVLPEPWARRIERTRIDSVDRTPGAATFGR